MTRKSWTRRLWADVVPTYTAILHHPFVAGLADGSLHPDAFAHYLVQDTYYLPDFARALSVVAGKAPGHADMGLLVRHAAATVDVELTLHESLLPELDIDYAGAAPAGPTTRAYTSYLLATAYGGSFADGVAAVLPCYWIYAKVGAELGRCGSPDPRYQRWIDTYSADDYQTMVAEVLDLANNIGETLCTTEEIRARSHFTTAARYEWMFWDAAWRRETWPV
ncbi:thiaminase II [Mycobacterium botniense]|uniref:thiaminase II n=1 Tax=Mycobacterium botniense TaxID=84962 RepID=UPI0013D351BA|nr:thiaminase II [Mycobacterium botniense]